MKTNFLSYSLFTLLMFCTSAVTSCSKDDKASPPEEEQTNEVLVQTIRMENDDNILVLTFEYNTNNTVSKIISSDGYTHTYSYDNEHISKLKFSDNGNTTEYDFEYDNNGILSTVVTENEQKDLVYDPTDNSFKYTFVLTNVNYENKFWFNANDDLIAGTTHNTDAGGLLVGSIDLTYDTTKKGRLIFQTM